MLLSHFNDVVNSVIGDQQCSSSHIMLYIFDTCLRFKTLRVRRTNERVTRMSE
jgi:hypothetical protein